MIRKFFIVLAVAGVLATCQHRSFLVNDIDQKETFVIKKMSPLPYIDPLVTVRLTGYLDGKAVVYIPNGSRIIDEDYAIRLDKGHVRRELSRAFTYERFSVVYQPITAKGGHLEIQVEAP
ncbi:hypothetical protein ACO2Q8_13110 [Larkinella sp. VNQ87]|uniref:hypothetical protein n=1 Tax=Larkinella sp. VNQ87 TaxID=3400921 RepID=UPI003C0BE5CB